MSRIMLAALALAVTAAPVAAQGWIDVERRVATAPSPVVRVSSHVQVTVDGRVARVEVEEQFRNRGGGIAEGTYLYPLPGEAVFDNFSLWMGNEEVRGEMLPADQARGIYEAIVRKLKDPALLTLEDHGLIRARVFPIAPGETRKVVLRYTQVLERSGDALRMRYAIGNRERVESVARGGGGAPGFADAFTFDLAVENGGRLGTPYSPTHTLTTERHDGQVRVSLDPEANGDVEIFLPYRRGLVGTSLVTHAPPGEDGYFMLLVAPPASGETVSIPRDLTLVVDVSGSMSGTKLTQAKAALREALGTLGTRDRFRLVTFSSGLHEFHDGWSAATPAIIAEARRYVDGLVAGGGTNIAGALDLALEANPRDGRLPILVFLTDGLPSVGERAPEQIASGVSARIGDRRIFTVGVGHDVNTYLLDRLAREGRGSAAYVPPEGDVEVAMGDLLGKLQHPALVNLRIVNQPVQFDLTYPASLPDLFYGEELVILGRYHGTGNGEVIIEGERAGRRERFTATATFPRREQKNDFLPKLWASRRIGELTRTIRLEGATPERIAEVRELGLRYGILTEYTSYLVQEPGSTLALQRRNTFPTAQSGVTAPVPRDQTGTRAFNSAKASAEMSAAGSVAATDQAAERQLREMQAGVKDDDALQVRRIGGRMFVLRDSVWTDAGQRDTVNTVSIAPYSTAWFDLARALPEVRPFLSGDEAILIAGKRASIRVAAGGRTTWAPGKLDAFVKAYRGQ